MPVSVASSLSPAEQEDALHRSGGACVRCGCSIFVFCRVEDHSSSPAFLLCPDCLRGIRASGVPDSVAARLRDSPIALHRQFDRGQFLFTAGGKLPDITFPDGTRMSATPCPIAFGGQPVLTLTPGNHDGPLLLSLGLGEGGGEPTIVVRHNQLVADPAEWAFERMGNRYAFRHRAGSARLRFVWRRPGEVVLGELLTRVKGRTLEIDRRGARLDGEPVPIPPVRGHLIGLSL